MKGILLMSNTRNMRFGHKSKKQYDRSRKGAVVVLAALLMIVMLALVAFVVDIGYLVSAKTEMQRTADAAALAAAWEMVNDNVVRDDTEAIDYAARNMAVEFAAQNEVVKTSPNLDIASDITVGYLANPADQNEQISFPDPKLYNTVQVRVQYNDEQNQPVSFFFAPLLGIGSQNLSVTAAATFSSGNTVGFQAPQGDAKSTLMPFVIKSEDWNDLLDGTQGTDEWAYDPETGTVSPGQDGIREMRMFPERQENKGKGKGGVGITPGNFGTVDIGNRGNGAPDLWRQIIDGPNAEDFSYYDNGVLELDSETGKLYLNGDTGMTASMGDHAVRYIIGDPKTIFLYEDATGQGNNTWFTITGFAGVRVMDYSMHGNDKYILIQPAMVVDSGAVPGDTDNSYFIGPPVQLVR